MTKTKQNIDELLAEESDAIEADRDAPIRPETKVTRGHRRTRTLQVRLNDDEYKALSRAARDKHLPESTFARAVLLESLNSSEGTRRMDRVDVSYGSRGGHRPVTIDFDDLLRAISEVAIPVELPDASRRGRKD